MKDDMKQFPGKRMPYKESDEYITSLIQNCADRAVKGDMISSKINVKRIMWQVSAVAAVLIIGFLAFFNLGTDSEYQRYLDSAPLNEVIASMSDEQVMDLYCYELDEIPEYYE